MAPDRGRRWGLPLAASQDTNAPRPKSFVAPTELCGDPVATRIREAVDAVFVQTPPPNGAPRAPRIGRLLNSLNN